MRKKLLFNLLLLFSYSLIGQNFTLNGRVVDDSDKKVAYCNVLVYNHDKSAVIIGTTTNDEGVFNFENVKTGDYVLEISYLGFADHITDVKINADTDLGVIVLKENVESLKGVTIVSKRPTIKRQVDRLVFNVENSTLSNYNTLDVLKHTPGVFVSDDKISIKNGEPTVYINDKRIHLSSREVQQLLEGTSANNIKSIEVITNPPARYEAEGGSVINIVTSKNIIAGYNGSIFGNYKQGEKFPKYMLGTNHFFKTKKFNTYLNYSFSPREDYRYNDELVNFMSNNEIDTRWKTDYKRVKQSANHNINVNVDYEIDENNTLGIVSNILIAPQGNTKTKINSLTEVYNSNAILDSLFNTKNNSVDETFNLAFTLDYTHKFKKEGEKLLISLHHTNFDNSKFQDVDTDYFLPDSDEAFRKNKFQTLAKQYIKLFTGQIDYELPLKNSGELEMGIKISSINSDNLFNQEIVDNGIEFNNLNSSDKFLYDEINYAGYVSYSKSWSSLDFKLGVRTEHTNLRGASIALASENKKEYFKAFPSLHLLKRFESNNELYFNYNRRIFRPRYNQLNPFKYYLSDNSYMTGDPNLKPQVDDVFTIGYNFNQNYTFEVYYRYEQDPALQITYQDNEDKVLQYINTNIDHNITYGFDFTTYKTLTKNWNLYWFSSLFYYENNFFALASNNELTSNEKWSVYGQIVNYFSFLKDKSLTADVTFQYISPINNGPSLISNRTGLNINLRKSFFNNKASLNIGITDLFNTQNFTETIQYLNQDISIDSNMENRLFIVGFNYKFGNSNLTTNEKSIELKERDRL